MQVEECKALQAFSASRNAALACVGVVPTSGPCLGFLALGRYTRNLNKQPPHIDSMIHKVPTAHTVPTEVKSKVEKHVLLQHTGLSSNAYFSCTRELMT